MQVGWIHFGLGAVENGAIFGRRRPIWLRCTGFRILIFAVVVLECVVYKAEDKSVLLYGSGLFISIVLLVTIPKSLCRTWNTHGCFVRPYTKLN